MNDLDSSFRNSDRILILAPTLRDAALCKNILIRAQINAVAVSNMEDLCSEIHSGAAAVLVTEESVEIDDEKKFLGILRAQPSWSDLPVIVMTKWGADSAVAAQALEWLGNVMLLERPVRINTLVSAARTALRARHRQYETRNHLVQHEQAEEALREKSSLLTEQTERLVRSNEELEQFAYVSSHDLQEPLRKLSTFAELLSERYGPQLDADGKRYLNIITTGAIRMTSLIRDLLAYARLGKEHTFDSVDLNRLIAHVLSDLDLLIQENKVHVTVDRLPWVFANSVHLHHVFLNLISNAIKFRAGALPRIHISATQTGGLVQLSIRDNGIGIEPNYSQQIFQVFQRLHPKTKYEGNGIGLAICKKIIEQHKGRIWVESTLGEGSTFHFTLPSFRSEFRGSLETPRRAGGASIAPKMESPRSDATTQ